MNHPDRWWAFLLVAFSVGASFASMATLLPLLVLAQGGASAGVGLLLAFITGGTAIGALAGGRLAARAGADRALAAALAADAAGLASFLVPLPSVALVGGCALAGFGMGVFWVASHVRLGTGPALGFVRHYAAYTAGTALGGPGSGLVVQVLAGGHHESPAEVRAAFLLGLGMVTLAGARWRTWMRPRRVRPRVVLARLVRPIPRFGERSSAVVRRGARLQLADFALVIGFNFLLTTQAVTLRRDFGLAPGVVGLVGGAVAAAKVTGGLLGRWWSARVGERAALVSLAATSAVLLAGAGLVGRPLLFVPLALAAVAVGLGQWPIVVAVAMRRMPDEHRSALVGSWNLREFLVISVASASSGWALDGLAGGRRTVLVAGAAFLAVGAVVTAATYQPFVVDGQRESAAGLG